MVQSKYKPEPNWDSVAKLHTDLYRWRQSNLTELDLLLVLQGYPIDSSGEYKPTTKFPRLLFVFVKSKTAHVCFHFTFLYFFSFFGASHKI